MINIFLFLPRHLTLYLPFGEQSQLRLTNPLTDEATEEATDEVMDTRVWFSTSSFMFRNLQSSGRSAQLLLLSRIMSLVVPTIDFAISRNLGTSKSLRDFGSDPMNLFLILLTLILLCNNRRVFDTSFILKILSYTTDTKLFEVKSILVKHCQDFIEGILWSSWKTSLHKSPLKGNESPRPLQFLES